MMSNNTKKLMSNIGAIGAAIFCLIMVFFEIMNQDIPTLVRFSLALSLLTYVVANTSLKNVK